MQRYLITSLYHHEHAHSLAVVRLKRDYAYSGGLRADLYLDVLLPCGLGDVECRRVAAGVRRYGDAIVRKREELKRLFLSVSITSVLMDVYSSGEPLKPNLPSSKFSSSVS